jgi:hypothetical protein
MAVTLVSSPAIHFMGASTDTKPTTTTPQGGRFATKGSTFFEYDTGKLYITYDGDNWAVKQYAILPANSGVDIGDVDVASIAAGSNLIGKVSEPSTVETVWTGTGNLAVGTNKIAPGAVFKLVEVSLHLNAAPTTGTQAFVVTLDDGVNAAYDEVLFTIDLVANAVTDLCIKFGRNFKATDVITLAWTNTDTKTYGVKFKHQLI